MGRPSSAAGVITPAPRWLRWGGLFAITAGFALLAFSIWFWMVQPGAVVLLGLAMAVGLGGAGFNLVQRTRERYQFDEHDLVMTTSKREEIRVPYASILQAEVSPQATAAAYAARSVLGGAGALIAERLQQTGDASADSVPANPARILLRRTAPLQDLGLDVSMWKPEDARALAQGLRDHGVITKGTGKDHLRPS